MNWRGMIIPVSLGMSIYHLVFAFIGYPIGEIHRPLHLVFVLVILFATKPKANLSPNKIILSEIMDIALIIISILGTGYLIKNAQAIQSRMIYVTPLTLAEKVFGCLLLIAVLEAARRTVGKSLAILGTVFILYGLLGHYLPTPFGHRLYSFGRILESLYLTKEGLWNIPIGVSANFIFIFVLFGSLLLASGAGAFFTDFAEALTGRYVGGTAKTAIVSSAFMGMLSGSSASNVVTTGSYTIPAMKRSGFDAPFAAGVEAVASSGGQLTPPIMGAAAFLMVEFVGVPYIEVIKAAIIPAILYFLAVFVMVDQSARYLDIAKQDTNSNRVLPLLLKKGYLLIPVVIMLYVLVQGFTPTAAGFWSIISLIILCILVDKNNRKRILIILYEAFTEAPKIMGPVAVACAIGGIIAGITITTGLGVKMSSIILGISRGNIPLTMLLTMFIAIFLGMGMPTSGAYIVLAALLAPGLVKLGIPIMAAHMFIIFSAASSTITPPVAIASYAAAAIADTDPWKTSVIAFKLGLSVFIIPFLFVYNPALLGDEGIPNALLAFLPAAVSVICLSMAIIGYFRRKMTIWERLGFLSVSIILITTSWKNIFAAIVMISVLIFIGNVLYKNKKERA